MAKTKENYLSKNIGFISLGCDKNRVDTEEIITKLVEYGFNIVANKEDADIIIVNTCSFLLAAREEAVSNILEMAALKESSLEKLIVVGCLPLIDDGTMKESLPEVDSFIVPKDYNDIVSIIYKLYDLEMPKKPLAPSKSRMLTTPEHYAYLKIADGCNNFCTFCKIPYIRGRYKSTPIAQLVKEAEALVSSGVKEIILVAQDLTRYGSDLQDKPTLVMLLRKLSAIKNLKWIRLLYCYPEKIDDELIQEIKTNPKIVKYLDVPMQHINSRILKHMGRKSDENTIKTLIKKLRTEIPEITLRSTFMVGFPSETRAEFKELCKFLTEFRLDNVGFFAYSREEGTRSYNYRYQISNFTKKLRLNKIKKVQEKVVASNMDKYIGKNFEVLCDGFDEEKKMYYGRAYFSCPDIDYLIFFNNDKAILGEFLNLKVTGFCDNYFTGEVLWIYQTKYQLQEYV